jgi:excisionase family DNA binding protein
MDPINFIREVGDMEDMDNWEMMTLGEVAEYLSVSVSTVRRLINRGDDPVPHIRLGKYTVRVPRTHLNQWIQNNMEA